MALINCPECGKEISDKAPACIHCGCPLQPATQATHNRIIELFDEFAATHHLTNSKVQSIYYSVKDEANHIKSTMNTQAAIDSVAKDIITGLSKIPSQVTYLDVKLFCELINFQSLSQEAMVYVTDQLYSVASIKHHYSDGSGGYAYIIQFYYPLYLVTQYGSVSNKEQLMSILKHKFWGNKTGYEFISQKYAENCNQDTLQQIAAVNVRNSSPKCPVCGSTSIKRISTLNRLGSIATFGLASGKIGKQYECKSCKHKW